MKKLIGIEGLPGSGKSYVAKELSKKLNCDVICIDNFYKNKDSRDENTFLKGGNNIDYNRFIKEIIIPFFANESITYSVYDCQDDIFIEKVTLKFNNTLIIEGNYIFREELFNYFTDTYFIKADLATIKSNIIKRSNEDDYQIFEKKWIPLAADYIKEKDIIKKVNNVINFRDISKFIY